ncbi:MAG TPA: hypothetical protein VNW95_10800 [Mucilaginibacter sp.]|jgi:hypothetical protein|nr:hypothetical protein [Mucilaginibacter sp.]
MRISLNKIEQIDNHLFSRGNAKDRLIFEAMLILDPALKSQLSWQKKTLDFVQHYGRKKMKAEMESVHRQLFSDPAHQRFRNKILSLFK